jgi:hypothetical protein
MRTYPKVAETIALQIGRPALVMLGARDLVGSVKENWLMFRIGRNKPGWTKIKIRLNGLDLYDLTFYRIRQKDLLPTVVAEKTVSDIYFDGLHDTIESETGLSCSL